MKNALGLKFEKENLNKAFKELRKRGYLARQNFMCCSNCAGTALADAATKLKDKGKDVRGCVFYHHQDAAALRYDPCKFSWRRRPYQFERMMIRFGSLDTTKYGEIGLPTLEVGKEVCSVFNTFGVPYEWLESEDLCIELVLR